MKYIPCTIETYSGPGEAGWQISVSADYAAQAALDFSALHLGCAERIVLADRDRHFIIRPSSVTLNQRTIAVDKT